MKLFLNDLKPSTLSVALSLVLLSSCAMTNQEPEEWLYDKDLVLQSLQDAHIRNAQLQEDIDAVSHKLLTLERAVISQESKVAGLEAEIKANEEATKKDKINRVKPKTEKKIVDLNKRLDVISAKLTQPTQVVVDNKSPNALGTEKNTYTAAYLALKSGRYDEASRGFVATIKAHPKGEYTAQSYFWLGESLAAQKRYKEALESFSVVINKFNKSSKYLSALMRASYIYQLTNQAGNAKTTLNRVIKEFPNSNEAERAKIQLEQLASIDGDKK